MKRIAICLRGFMDKIKSGHFHQMSLDNIYENQNPYINFRAVHNSINIHIIQANPEFKFDFFIHSWNPDLKEDLDNLYKPKLSKYENQREYQDLISANQLKNFGYTAQQLGISKSLELLRLYTQQSSETRYDLVIIYRPDVLLYKDMKMKKYARNEIYVNSEEREDFHFVMNFNNAMRFRDIFGSKSPFVDFFKKTLGKQIIADDIKCGKHQEVLRKLNFSAIKRHSIDKKIFHKYGLTNEEINQLNNK